MYNFNPFRFIDTGYMFQDVVLYVLEKGIVVSVKAGYSHSSNMHSYIFLFALKKLLLRSSFKYSQIVEGVLFLFNSVNFCLCF